MTCKSLGVDTYNGGHGMAVPWAGHSPLSGGRACSAPCHICDDRAAVSAYHRKPYDTDSQARPSATCPAFYSKRPKGSRQTSLSEDHGDRLGSVCLGFGSCLASSHAQKTGHLGAHPLLYMLAAPDTTMPFLPCRPSGEIFGLASSIQCIPSALSWELFTVLVQREQVAQCSTKAMSCETPHLPTAKWLLGIRDVQIDSIASIATRCTELQSSNDNLPFQFTRIHPSSECKQWTARP